ncbi:MAG: hypothetical protein OQL27_02240 [Sedimenticola sp.]|nr:hypothetical protein [Sedimenticola sp.]
MKRFKNNNLPIRVVIKSVILIFCFSTTVVMAAESDAVRSPCPGSKVHVNYRHRHDFKLVCEAIELLVPRVAQWRMQTGITTEVIIKDQVDYKNFEDAPPMQVYGLYQRQFDLIQLISWNSPSLYPGSRQVLGLDVDETLHRSVIIHELSHAFIRLNAHHKLSSVGQEFWAYVLQLDMLPEEYRNKIMAHYPGRFESREEINSIQHAVNPSAFGVQAYRWYQEQGDGLMQEILDGDFTPDQLLDAMVH